MKQENGDINAVEQAHFPKFSKLDNIEASLSFLNHSLIMHQLILLLATPSCMVIVRKHLLVLKLLMKHFSSFQACYCLVGAISFYSVKCVGTRPSILLYYQYESQCPVIRLSVFFEISMFVTRNNQINKANSRSFVSRLMPYIREFKVIF